MVVYSSAYAYTVTGYLGKKTLSELRQMYFKMKEDIFAKSGFEIGYNTNALEKILKQTFDSDMKMSDMKEPQLVIDQKIFIMNF